jgi:hypothetical protein
MVAKMLWGGFCDDRLDLIRINDGFGGENIRFIPAVFNSRKEARRQYADVRKIELREL